MTGNAGHCLHIIALTVQNESEIRLTLRTFQLRSD